MCQYIITGCPRNMPKMAYSHNLPKMAVMDHLGFSWTITDYHGLSWTQKRGIKDLTPTI